MKIKLAMLLAAALFAGAAQADTKIGYVNTERLLREAPLSLAAQKRLEKEFSSRDAELQKLAKQVRDLQGQLDRNGVTMADSERRGKERELANLSTQLQRDGREFREDLNSRRNEELGKLQEVARKVIQDIARNERYDLVVDQAVYAAPNIDITDRVIKALGTVSR